VDRVRVTQIGQAARSFQRILITCEEAALIECQIRAASAASQAESIISAASRIKRTTPRICFLIQAQIAARPCKIAVFLETILGEAAAHASAIARVALPGLLLLLFLHDAADIALDSRASPSKSGSASYSTAITLDAAGFPIGRRDIFLFLLFLHLYDLILKVRKRAMFNQCYGTAT
jgi:hypothetical protein